jgi:hypothetical protein
VNFINLAKAAAASGTSAAPLHGKPSMPDQNLTLL